MRPVEETFPFLGAQVVNEALIAPLHAITKTDEQPLRGIQTRKTKKTKKYFLSNKTKKL